MVGMRPVELADRQSSGLPSGWEVRHSKSKNLPYYFHSENKESRWEPPPGSDSDKLKAFMAQHHSSHIPNGFGNTESEKGDKIRAAHLLVKHRDSRRPASWREAEITRSKDEALEILKVHQQRIQNGEISLGELAMSESDCSSARKQGDLCVTLQVNADARGYFGHGEMQKEFETAAFKLQPGEISGIIETASGLHLIQR